jgi:hypothetical protein
MAVMLTSGILLFLSEAMKCYGNTSFRWKMFFLFFALLFQFTIYNRIVKNEGDPLPSAAKSPLPLRFACGSVSAWPDAPSVFSARTVAPPLPFVRNGCSSASATSVRLLAAMSTERS